MKLKRESPEQFVKIMSTRMEVSRSDQTRLALQKEGVAELRTRILQIQATCVTEKHCLSQRVIEFSPKGPESPDQGTMEDELHREWLNSIVAAAVGVASDLAFSIKLSGALFWQLSKVDQVLATLAGSIAVAIFLHVVLRTSIASETPVSKLRTCRKWVAFSGTSALFSLCIFAAARFIEFPAVVSGAALIGLGLTLPALVGTAITWSELLLPVAISRNKIRVCLDRESFLNYWINQWSLSMLTKTKSIG